MLQSSDIWTVC